LLNTWWTWSKPQTLVTLAVSSSSTTAAL
jgi:hypothetical protein